MPISYSGQHTRLTTFVCRPAKSHSGEYAYSVSNPWLMNFSDRLFSVTVRTTVSGTAVPAALREASNAASIAIPHPFSWVLPDERVDDKRNR
jgi:hypothetical protein